METLMPNGDLLREHFKNDEAMGKRRKELEAQGGKVQRVLRSIQSRYEPDSKPKSKYDPHQGKREMERRRRQMAANR